MFHGEDPHHQVSIGVERILVDRRLQRLRGLQPFVFLLLDLEDLHDFR
jgi:hypothetical protein